MFREFVLLASLLYLGNESVHGIQRWGTQFGQAPLLERFFWRTLDYAYPDEASKTMAMMKGEYIPENALPVGIEIWRNKLFVTVPRWRNGKSNVNTFLFNLLSPKVYNIVTI